MKNQFIKDTSKAIVTDYPNDTLLVYRDGYALPELKGVEYMDFEKFKLMYSGLHFNMLILVGLNRIITPSNRCGMVNEYMQTMTQNIPKISIDNNPFIGEPWRIWFHYSVTNTGKFNLTYSYAIETEWQHWFYRNTNNCRLSGDNIGMFVNDTYSNLDQLTPSFYTYQPDKRQIEWYDQAKEHVFSKYNTPKLLINNLLKLSNKFFQLNISMDSFRVNDSYNLPDIGIYRFMIEENRRRLAIYNRVIR